MRISSFASRLDAYIQTRLKKIRRSHFDANIKRDEDLVFKLRKKRAIPTWTQLRYLGKFYSETEKLVTKLAFLIILISTATFGVIVYRNYIETTPATGGEYAEAVIGAPTFINPLFSQTNDVDQDLSRLIFSSLMRPASDGGMVGDLAESYEIDEEQKVYTFTLRDDAYWHDGEPITAEDVVFTVESIKDQEFKSPLYVTFRNVQVRLINDRTVSFTLPEPFSPFLSIFTFGILPEHLWNTIDPSHAILAELNLKPIGSGPYRFASYTKDKKGNIISYKLKRNEDYYQDGPYIDTLVMKFFQSVGGAQSALEAGNVDGFGFLPQNIQTETQQTGITTHHFSLPQYTALFFNQGSNPALAEKDVRFALSLATSRHTIISTTFGDLADPVYGPILPGFVGYDESIQQPLFDPSQAASLLDAAGWERVYEETELDPASVESTDLGINETTGTQYTRQKTITRDNKKEETPLEVTLTTIQRSENIQVAETIRNLWQAIGVKVNVHIVDIAQFQKDVIKSRAYEVLLFGQIIGRDPDPYPFWHSSQSNDPGLNLAQYKNKEADKLLEDARRISDTDERHAKYVAFQKLLLQEAPAIFLYSLNYTYITPTYIQGINTERITQTADRFSEISKWYIKTKKRINFSL